MSEIEENSPAVVKKKRKIWPWVVLGITIALILSTVLVGLLVSWDQAKAPWDFVSSQILGMAWLNALIGSAVEGMWGSAFHSGLWGKSIQFFVYDFIKIGLLLCFLIFLISYIQSFFPPEKTKKILSKYNGIGGNIIGALLGTVTPFCSCSSIPIFIGFTRAGLSSGITFSFLISSPLVDLGSLLLLVSIFGWPIAIVYVITGLILAVIGGTIIDKTGLGKNVEDFVLNGSGPIDIDSPDLTVKDRLTYARDQMWQTYKKVFWYIVVGVGIGAVIHNLIPEAWVETALGGGQWYSVPIATLIGVPMYADIFGTIPIAEALFAKGAGLGTILAFMMSVTALSLPSLIMLRKAVKPKLLVWFMIIVIIGIMIIGFGFNAFGYLFI